MITIYKFTLETDDEQIIELPSHHEVLSVQVQNSAPCIWFKVQTESEPCKVKISIYGTGHPIEEDNQQFVGTYQLLDGQFVGHVFYQPI